MKYWLVYDGKPLSDFGCYITNAAQYNTPKRDTTMKSIPGRNGDLTIDNGRYENIPVKYSAYIYENAEERMDWLNAFLMSHTSYARLEDTVHPEVYRMGKISGPIEHKTTKDAAMSSFTLEFDCKPQRFLKDGELWKTVASGTILYNRTWFAAKPLIRVSGAGTIAIGDTAVTIANNSYGSIDINSETMDCYSGSADCNGLMTGDFPELATGENRVTFSGFSSVKIKPNWWTL